MSESLISIIIPVYNVDKFIEACINSVIRQPNYNKCEVVLIDDGSSDSSPDICDEFASKYNNIRVFHKENQGLSEARNDGIRNSAGKYILFLDGDDMLEESCLPEIEKIISSKQPDVVIGKYKTLCEGNRNFPDDIYIDSKRINGQVKNDVLTYLASLKKFVSIAPRYIVKRDMLIEKSLFFLKGILHEDEEWTPRLLCSSNIYCLYDKPFYIYRIRESGSITCSFTKRNIESYFTIIESLYSFYKSETEGAMYFLRCRIERYMNFIIYNSDRGLLNIVKGKVYKDERYVMILKNPYSNSLKIIRLFGITNARMIMAFYNMVVVNRKR